MRRYYDQSVRYLILILFAVITTCLLGYINKQQYYEKVILKLQYDHFDQESFRNMEFKEDTLSSFFNKSYKMSLLNRKNNTTEEQENTNDYIDHDHNTSEVTYENGNEENDNKKDIEQQRIQDEIREKQLQDITMSMLVNNYTCNKQNMSSYKLISKTIIQKLKHTQAYQEYLARYRTILSDITYFPVAQDTEEQYMIFYDNSWNAPRTYGGKRTHEGTDIMTNCNKRGIYPIVSVSDGVVENKGWLEQGGYRIGIRSNHGGYYYYAHLHSYAPDLEIGDTVIAGQLLGFMGDTGYSKTEGTTGNFDVHLHFGIYYNEGNKETSVNPYYILKYLEKNKLYYKNNQIRVSKLPT